MYIAIAALGASAYLYFDEKSVLKKLKAAGVTVADADLQKRITNA